MDMIDTFVKLVEKLIELFKNRKEAEEKTFELVVTPTYTDLMTIHNDYLRLFETCRQNLADKVELPLVAQQLSRERLEREALRRSVAALVAIFQQNEHLRRYHRFFEAVTVYLSGDEDETHPGCSNSSWLLREIEYRCGHMADAPAIDLYVELLRRVERVLWRIRDDWEKVCTQYARLSAEQTAG